jgi:hypothetical protein
MQEYVMRPIIAIAAAALLAVAFVPTEASARMGGADSAAVASTAASMVAGSIAASASAILAALRLRGTLRLWRLCGLAVFLRLCRRLRGAAPRLDPLRGWRIRWVNACY